MNVDDRRLVVVVGGASGSGLATVRALAALGDHVLIADINGIAAADAAAALKAEGASAEAAVVDIGDERSVERLARRIRAHGRPIDVLYNSAAITDPAHQRADSTPAEVSLEIWNRTLAVDLTGVMLTCRALLPLMRAPGGVIVNVTSNAGLRGNDTLVSYGVAKAGLHQLTRAIATAYGHLGIRCNALSPASIASESFLRNIAADVAESMRSVCLLPELGTVDDVASLARFLCSADAAYITGEIVRVDGGALGHLAGAAIPPAVPARASGRDGRPTVVAAGTGPLADVVAGRLAADRASLELWSPSGRAATSTPHVLCLVVSAADPPTAIVTFGEIVDSTAARMASAGGGAIVAAVPCQGSVNAAADVASAAVTARVLRAAADHGRSGVRANVVTFDPAIEQGERAPGALLPGRGSPDDVAGPIAFLASTAARFITGVVVRVDGGRHIRLPHTVAGINLPSLNQEFSA